MISVPITIAWPNDLPLPVMEHQGSSRNTTLVSPVENAAIKRRRRTRRTYATLNASWVLNVAQFDLFQSFVGTTLGNATALFSIDLRYPKTSDLINYAVRIATEYQAQTLEGYWTVNAQLDIVGVTLVSDPAIIVELEL